MVKILLILAILCVVYNKQISDMVSIQKNNLANEFVSENAMPEADKVSVEIPETEGTIAIPVNQPIALSYKTRDEVYNIRKSYVEDSIFKIKDYEPSAEVFGGIEDRKPWMSTNMCKDKNGNILVSGPSEESRFIVNPAVLVAIEYPFYYSGDPRKAWCTDSTYNLIPKKIEYIRNKKTIEVTYSKLPYETKNSSAFYTFNGINARDLGYKYAYVDKNNSTYLVKFTEQDNISSRVIEFQNYIHLGGSCGRDGGCNNGSPRQSYLEFKDNPGDYTQYYQTIYIKLWKDMPKSPSAPADLIEKIILEEG